MKRLDWDRNPASPQIPLGARVAQWNCLQNSKTVSSNLTLASKFDILYDGVWEAYHYQSAVEALVAIAGRAPSFPSLTYRM